MGAAMNYQDILTPEFIDEIVRKEMECTRDLQQKYPREVDNEDIAKAAEVIRKYYGG